MVAAQPRPLEGPDMTRGSLRPHSLTYARLTSTPFLHRRISALTRMGEIFAEQLDRYGCASAGFTRWNDIGERMPGVVSARLLSARCDDGWTTDRHSFAVGATPIPINRIRESWLDNSKQCRADRSS